MLATVMALFFASVLLPAFRVVPLKMLPYDNKNEFQIVVDLPEGSTLEQTDAATRALFRAEACFGLPSEDVRFFTQGTLPNVDFEGRILLEAPDRIAVSPDGHGGVLPALAAHRSRVTPGTRTG